jgi:hypothetical protein
LTGGLASPLLAAFVGRRQAFFIVSSIREKCIEYKAAEQRAAAAEPMARPKLAGLPSLLPLLPFAYTVRVAAAEPAGEAGPHPTNGFAPVCKPQWPRPSLGVSPVCSAGSGDQRR